MAKGRGSYKCGKCSKTGHNARKCPQKTAKVTAPEPVAKAEVTEEFTSPPVAISQTQNIMDDAREVPSRPARPPAPFDCPSCGRVGILALLELSDGNRKLCCEYCQTKSRPKKILKWGALPSDKPTGGPGYSKHGGIISYY